MKIGIDICAIEKKGTGNWRYIKSLLAALLKIDKENTYYIYTKKNLDLPWYNESINSRNTIICRKKHFGPISWKIWLGAHAKKNKIDVLHTQYYTPLFFHGVRVVTIHDCAFLAQKKDFSFLERAYLSTAVLHSTKKADEILTVSEFSCSEIKRIFPHRKDNVTVVYNGVDEMFFTHNKEKCWSCCQDAGIPKTPFLLYVGRINSRKNIDLLIKAWQAFKKTHLLVIVGATDYIKKEVKKTIAAEKDAANIKFISHVSDAILKSIYVCADVFVYPSFYEGFGLPCLEAMACGCPVVAGNALAFHELYGDAIRYCKGSSVENIVAEIDFLLKNPKKKEEYAQRGMKRAQRFSWEKTAQETLNVYKKAYRQRMKK